MSNIVLTGFMGSGKTAVAKALSKKTGMKIEDTDLLIEKKAGLRIRNIFGRYGEKHFRRLETAVVRQVSKKKDRIIATGGGIVIKKENVRALKKNGLIVYLKNTFATSKKRLKGKKDRPLFREDNLSEARKLYRKRLKLYGAAADITVVTDKKSISKVVSQIIRKTGIA